MDNHYLTRPDRASAVKVDLAVAVQAAQGTRSAADYLKQTGIAFTVALRVLTRPHRRRWAS
ncbi:hypothetical protein HHL21_02020 [Massilia sp. RP-1-19]|uniref:Uncharacterized protein n=1 Tax=Massilia polaris TaxID=2728846 RepID=A0A848HFM3_9BURK|nr:hypothetical protein [Massilia polaris]NML59877.1 hypothetical protein [Massilia polaris]